jgi:hypothetical protein
MGCGPPCTGDSMKDVHMCAPVHRIYTHGCAVGGIEGVPKEHLCVEQVHISAHL